MKEYSIYRQYLLIVSIISAVVLTACDGDTWTAEQEEPEAGELADVRQLVHHEVTVGLEGAATRVDYNSNGDGLQLSWEASETLGVYIRKANNSLIYAGQMTSTGSAGDRGERKFSGTVSQKQDGEQYVYMHPALSGETKDQPAQGKIVLSSQSGSLGSIAHLKNYIPLIWREGSSQVENHGYAVHLTLTFNEDPGTITKVTLRTMPDVGSTKIFPSSFEASTMSANAAMNSELTLNVTSGIATKTDDKWTADAYLACSHRDVDVFRTKYDVKVETETNGTFYNEFVSFPGQQDATSITGLPMLANGKCYNLDAKMSKDAATTIINTQYKVNSLLGMWDTYGKTSDPFSLKKVDDDTKLPTQLKSNILTKKSEVLTRILSSKSSQGTPIFTWDLLVNQMSGSGDGARQTNVTYNNLLITRATEVYLTFVSEYAWSQNLLGYYHYPTSGGAPSAPGEVLKTIIFPNVSKSGHVPFNKDGVDGGANINPNGAAKNIGNLTDAPLAEFTTVQLLYNNNDGSVSTTFPKGTTIGFMMMRDTQASNGGSSSEDGTDTPEDHSSYSPRKDNTLINWNAWRLFTNTSWNTKNAGWYGGNCSNYFVSGKVVGTDGNVINGLAICGAKDDADHNNNYSFSSMLFMVSSSDAEAMTVQVPGALNLAGGALVVTKP